MLERVYNSENRVLIIVGGYLPGRDSGGPVTSLVALIEALGSTFQFFVLAPNRDVRSKVDYPLPTFEWIQRGKEKVMYAPVRNFTFAFLRSVVTEVAPESLYLQGIFCWHYTIKILILRKLGVLNGTRVVVSSRGMLSSGALALKPFRKQLYLKIARLAGLFNGVTWHASSNLEKWEIQAQFGANVEVIVARNLTQITELAIGRLPQNSSEEFSLRLVFLSRISEKKGLHVALQALQSVSMRLAVVFDVYGPKENYDYLAFCEGISKRLPSNIEVNWMGGVDHSDVVKVLNRYDLMILPTKGENFGHVIVESLAAGCPVLISDQTPFRDLQAKGAGYDLSLNDIRKFSEKIEEVAYLTEETKMAMRRAARQLALGEIANPEAQLANASLFARK